MGKVIVYSTHNYTAAIATRLHKLDLDYVEAKTEEQLLDELASKSFSLIILDSSSEHRIFELVKHIEANPKNLHASVLFLVPGKISYEDDYAAVSQRAILGLSKPFSPSEFANVANFLLHKSEQQDQIDASFKELEYFTVMASHDLKTPIKNVYSYADIALEEIEESGAQIDPEVIECINVIRSESKRMINFVNDMFEFSNAGNLKFSYEPIAFPDFINNIFSMVSAEHQGREMKLMPVNLPDVFYGDKSKLSHIFQNLIENAIKYSPTDAPLELQVGQLDTAGKQACFFVQDNGGGIDSDDLDKIFLPFRRGRSTVKGTGIGLAIVKKLVQAHQGTIEVESKPNHGSRFTFTIMEMAREAEHEVA